MALQAFLTGVSSALTIADLGTTDDAVVGAQATLISATAAIFGSGGGHHVAVLGAVYATDYGVYLGGAGTSDNVVKISQTGQIMAESTAIYMAGLGGSVENWGDVNGGYGIIFSLEVGGSCSVANYGTMGGGVAIRVIGDASAYITNNGQIAGTGWAYYVDDLAATNFVNRGTISGSMNFGAGNDFLTSTGGIIGSIQVNAGNDSVTLKGANETYVDLGEGNDSFNGRNLALQNISLYGGLGDDYFTLGTAEESVDGGDGVDTINLSYARVAMQISLDGSVAGTGLASGDSYYNVEILFAGQRNDRVTGSNAANSIYGNDGNDVLFGGGGADRLSGGIGVDQLTGGTGNDVFQFGQVPTESADQIFDFRNIAGNNDVIEISAIGFGGGLVAGSLAPTQFQLRADHVAQDADDRFIFDTTDRSLWFDIDGNGVVAAVMIADLQALATFSVADISLI